MTDLYPEARAPIAILAQQGHVGGERVAPPTHEVSPPQNTSERALSLVAAQQRCDTGPRDLDKAQRAHEIGKRIDLVRRAGDFKDE